jgi:hypothetical protein
MKHWTALTKLDDEALDTIEVRANGGVPDWEARTFIEVVVPRLVEEIRTLRKQVEVLGD